MYGYSIDTWKRISQKMIKTQWKDNSLWAKPPSFQVVILADNNEDKISSALRSVDQAINNFDKDCKWILQLGDNESEDQTLLEVSKYASETSADKIHIYDFDREEKKGINENKLINELHRYEEEYPAILFMEAGGKMLEERPMMFYTAASYNAPWVVGAWTSNYTSNYHNSDDAAYELQFGPWATLMHISALPKDGKFFYENINKGRDVLAWNQMRYVQNIEPVAHVRPEDLVHVYHHSDEDIENVGTSIIFQKQEITDEAPARNPSLGQLLKEAGIAKEGQRFLNMKSQLKAGHDILKDVEQ